MKFLVILRMKDNYFMLSPEKQLELMEGSFAFVDKHRQAGNCIDVHFLPGAKGTVSIWEADSSEEVTLRFLENPMSPYEDAQMYLLSDWDSFKNTIRKIYRQKLTKK